MDPGKFLLQPPLPTESIRAKLGLPPPQMDVGPYAYVYSIVGSARFSLQAVGIITGIDDGHGFA